MGSEVPQGLGWWKASDGRWYAPEQHADPGYRARFATPPPPPPPTSPPGGPAAQAAAPTSATARTVAAPSAVPTAASPVASGPLAVAVVPAGGIEPRGLPVGLEPVVPGAPVTSPIANGAGPWAHAVTAPSQTPSPTQTPSPAQTPSPSPTPSPTQTPSPTPSPTPTPTSTSTPPGGFEPAPSSPADGPRSSQRWPFVLGAVVLVLVVLGIMSATLAPSDDDHDGALSTTTSTRAPGVPFEPATTAAPTTPTTTAPSSPAGATRGSRDAPLPLGELFTLRDPDNGDIDVTVNTFVVDGGPAIAAENQFNQPPPSGHQYLLVGVTMTYHAGAKRESLAGVGLAVSMSAFGASAVELDDFSCNAVLPERLNSFAELLDGGTVSGNECILAPVVDAAGPLLLRVRESLCLADCDEVWVALQ